MAFLITGLACVVILGVLAILLSDRIFHVAQDILIAVRKKDSR